MADAFGVRDEGREGRARWGTAERRFSALESGTSGAVLLAGRAGGQQVPGGTAASEDLTLTSTANATKDRIFLGAAKTSAYDEANDRLGIGDPTPDFDLDVNKTVNGSVQSRTQNDSTGTSADARTSVMAPTSNAGLIAFGSGYNAATLFGLPAIASWQFLLAQAGSGLGIGANISVPIVFGTNNLERARIEADGTVKLYQTVASTATFTKSADTTLAAVTGLSFNVAAGRTYRFEAELHIDAPAAGGYKLGVGGTATATSFIAWIEVASNAPAVTLGTRSTVFGGGAGVTAALTGRGRVTGTIVVNAAGTLAPVFAQNAASGASTVAAGSSFQIWPV